MDRQEFEIILDAKIIPLQKSIDKLDKGYEKMIEVLSSLARQDERITSNRNEILKFNNIHDDIYSKIRTIEKESGNKLWDFVKILVSTIVASIIGLFIGRVTK